MTRMNPLASRYTRAGCHLVTILQRFFSSQSMQVRAVELASTAAESARIAISTSWSMPNDTSWLRVRCGP